MALFTDGTISTLEDLKAYESSVLETASTEGIDLTSKLLLAQRETGFEVTAFLARQGHISPGQDLGRVIVTEPLQHLHRLRALELIYRDAYNSQLNDRHLGKWKKYAQLSHRATELLFDIGVGLTNTPIARGSAAVVNLVPGGALPATTYYVSLAWQLSSGFSGERSTAAVIPAGPGTLLSVSAPAAPPNAVSWNVYCGASDNEMRRQNPIPMGLGESWIEAASGLRSDLPDTPSQTPDYYVTARRVLRRG